MRKRIVIISLIIAVLITTPVFLYFYFRPKAEMPKSNYISDLYDTTVIYNDFIKKYTHEKGKQIIYLDDGSKDSHYVVNSVLTPLSIQGDKWLPDMIVVSLKENKDMTVTQLKDRFEVERTPSFIIYNVDDKGVCTILSTITHYAEEPITEVSLKKWLVSQKMWNGPYDVE